MTIALKVLGGTETGLMFNVVGKRIIVGRGVDSDLVLSDHRVSRRQFEISVEEDRIYLKSLSAKNSTAIGNEDVNEGRLHDGSVISVPPYEIIVRSPRGVDQLADAPVPTGVLEAADDVETEALPALSPTNSPFLEIEDADGGITTYPLNKSHFTVGRSPSNDIVLADTHVSRRHAEFVLGRRGISIRGMTNRVVEVNGESVDETHLADEDVVSIYPFKLRVKNNSAPDAGYENDCIPTATIGSRNLVPVESRVWLVDDVSGENHILGEGRNLIGRSILADVRVSSKYASRNHAEILISKETCRIHNLSKQTPVRISGTSRNEAALHDGDIIEIDECSFVFRSNRPQDHVLEDEMTMIRSSTEPTGKVGEEGQAPVPDDTEEAGNEDERTFLASSSDFQPIGARILVDQEGQDEFIHPLADGAISIGRAKENDLRLIDPSVSRRHIVIEKKSDGYHFKSITGTFPVRVNDKDATFAHLFSGDRMEIGQTLLTFLSDHPEDLPPTPLLPAKVSKKRSSLGAMALGLVVLIGSGYFAYANYVTPWLANRELDYLEFEISSGEVKSAIDALEALLAKGAPPETSGRIRGLLVNAARTQNTAMKKTDLQKKRAHLRKFLGRHGAWIEAEPLRVQLDTVHFELGEFYHAKDDLQGAVRELLAVRSDSEMYDKAQKRVSEIWNAFQTRKIKLVSKERNDVTDLIRKAETRFQSKQYLRPDDNNAYGFYLLVLEREPENTLALARIDQIKEYYRGNGDTFFADKKFDEAISNYKRYLQIDPLSKAIHNRIASAEQNLSRLKTPTKGSDKVSGTEIELSKDRVRMLLEESGVDSNIVLDYLFEEDSKDADEHSIEANPW